MFWFALVVLLLIAIAFVVWPMLRDARRMTATIAAVIVVVVALSAGLYQYNGSPGVPSGAGSTPDVNEMVASLAARLEENPDDLNGWIMLGRSYQTLQQFDTAIAAYEKAVELDGGGNPQTLVALGLAVMGQHGGQMNERAVGLFENALALDPNNPNALFYAGGAAAQRGNTALAADRWEILLGLNAPPEVRELLQSKINEWRGVTPPEAVQPVAPSVTVDVSLSEATANALTQDATVFIIARDPAQPSPPVAVARRRTSELPSRVELSDRDAMIPGRPLSGFSKLELVARVSLSGTPTAQAGDRYATAIVDRSSGGEQVVKLVIDQVVGE
tara:strand:- start:2288 stop:3280 length:993 start_codon:yes stop_codon:yes gene_type:complete